jgi:hypothetical protein
VPKLDDKTKKVLLAFADELHICSEGLRYLDEMKKILIDDLTEITKIQASEENNDTVVRTYLRGLFAWVEATIFGLKRIALKMSGHKKLFSPAELAMLQEQTYDLDEKGNIKLQPKLIPLTKNLRFAFATCSRAFGIANTLNVGDARWDSFQKAIEMRNRITHPRTPKDLHLSEQDFEQIKLALFWFSENYRTLITEFTARLEKLEKLLPKQKDAQP